MNEIIKIKSQEKNFRFDVDLGWKRKQSDLLDGEIGKPDANRR